MILDCDELIREIIFTDKCKFDIDMSDYLDDIYEYQNFIIKIDDIIKKSNIKIIKSKVKLNSKTANWILKVKK